MGVRALIDEEIGEKNRGTNASYDCIGASEAAGSPEFTAGSVDNSHVSDGDIAETVNDGVSAASALAGGTQEFEDDSGKEGVASADGEEVESCADVVGEW